MNKRTWAAAVFAAGAFEEFLISLEHVDVLRQYLPQWLKTVASQQIALPLLLVGAVLLLMRERNQAEEKRAEQPQSTAATAAQSPALPSINLTNVLHAPQTQTTTQPQEKKQKIASSEKGERPKPNLKLVSERIAKLNVKTDGRHMPTFMHFFESPTGSMGAAVVTFRNQTKEGTTVPRAEHIRAHIIFRTRSGEEIGAGIATAPWLGEYHNTVDISQGESKTMLIGFCEKGKLHAFNNRRSVFASNYGDDIPDDGLEELEAEASPLHAEVQLLNYSGDVLISHRFEIDTSDTPTIKRLP